MDPRPDGGMFLGRDTQAPARQDTLPLSRRPGNRSACRPSN